MKQYLEMLDYVLTKGKQKADRTGTGTLTVFDYTLKFDMGEGFPLVTTKKMHLKSIIHELLWFLRGEQYIDYLQANGVTIWDEWAAENGHVGPIYGWQWRKWRDYANDNKIDQITELISSIKNNPNSRRQLVSAWNVADLPSMKLPPCHFAFQCQVMDGKLNMKVFMRSLDIFLGAPFDIASYAFLLHMLAEQTNLIPGIFVLTATDVHLYNNHIEQAKLQLTRTPLSLPYWHKVKSIPKDIDSYTFDYLNYAIYGYLSHPAIKAPIAV